MHCSSKDVHSDEKKSPPADTPSTAMDYASSSSESSNQDDLGRYQEII